MKSILIIGAGQFGVHIAKRMSELRCEVMAVDSSETRINEILPYVTNAVIGDGTSAEFLKTLGVRDYDVSIVTIGDNFQNSLQTTALLKELGSPYVVARASNDVQMKFLLRNGADEVTYPEKQTAMRIATKHASDSIMDYIQLDDQCSIYEMRIPKEWNGKTLVQLDIRKKYNLNIIAIKDGNHVTVPTPSMEMQEGDEVFVIGDIRDISKCFKV
ncbi:MAG: TrkA family potassium uptake protein [Oscillospiraceae bacterium]|nr:TrkA family potassium uptake protein [Oscillospiraceae bacterium]